VVATSSETRFFFRCPMWIKPAQSLPIPFSGILTPKRGTPLDWSNFAGSVYFGQFPPNMRPQYQNQYNLTIKRELPGNMLLQLAYVGSQGHRLLATYE